MSDFSGTKDFLYKIQKDKLVDVNEGIKTTTNNDDRKNVLDLKILVIVDISGSISPRQFRQFMQQIDAIKGLSVVKVLETDDRVVALYSYFKVNQGRVMRLTGGGGTEFSEAFKLAEQINPDAVLVLTDGEIVNKGVKKPKFPVGWILTHDGVNPPYSFGEVITRLPPL